jgi:predicted DCC family thiol-disulfide oxidoreductase YuxK
MQSPRSYPAVVFDGSCGFCRAILNFLQKRFDFSNIEFIPYSKEASILWNFPEEVNLGHDSYMYFLSTESEYTKGYFAFKNLFKTNKNLKRVAFFMGFKLIEIIGRVIYILISKNRSKLSGRNSSCGI